MKKSKAVFAVNACRCRPSCGCGLPRCRCIDKCKCVVNSASMQDLEYLGYRFHFSDLTRDRTLSITIAKKKIAKIKSRIVHAFLSHAQHHDYALLKKRIMFLTGNHFIEKSGRRSRLKAGIFYSYPMITDKSCLSQLDMFLQKVAFSHSGSLGRRIGRSLTMPERRQLVSHSFLFGFNRRVIHTFNGQSVREIKHCWSYERN